MADDHREPVIAPPRPRQRQPFDFPVLSTNDNPYLGSTPTPTPPSADPLLDYLAQQQVPGLIVPSAPELDSMQGGDNNGGGGGAHNKTIRRPDVATTSTARSTTPDPRQTATMVTQKKITMTLAPIPEFKRSGSRNELATAAAAIPLQRKRLPPPPPSAAATTSTQSPPLITQAPELPTNYDPVFDAIKPSDFQVHTDHNSLPHETPTSILTNRESPIVTATDAPVTPAGTISTPAGTNDSTVSTRRRKRPSEAETGKNLVERLPSLPFVQRSICTAFFHRIYYWLVWLGCEVLDLSIVFISHQIIRRVYPAGNRRASTYFPRTSHQGTTFELEVPVWADWLAHKLIWIFIVLAVILVFWAIGSHVHYRASRPAHGDVLCKPAILTPDAVRNFVHQYKYFTVHSRTLPARTARGQVAAVSLSGDSDVDDNGIDDNIDRQYHDAEVAQREQALNAAYGNVAAVASDQLGGADLTVPSLYGRSDDLCTCDTYQYNPGYTAMISTCQCWDLTKSQLDEAFNVKYYLAEGDLQRRYLTSGQSRRLEMLEERRKKYELMEARHRHTAHVPEFICLNNIDLGITKPFVYFGIEGANTTLAFLPEILPFTDPASVDMVRQSLEEREAVLDSTYFARAATLDKASRAAFDAAQVYRSITQPASVKLRYKALPSQQDVSDYFTDTFGTPYEAKKTGAKYIMQDMRNRTAGAETLQLVDTIADFFTSQEERDALAHTNAFIFRDLIKAERSRQAQLYTQHQGYKMTSSQLQSIKIRFAETSHQAPPPTPRLETKELVVYGKAAQCVVNSIVLNQALERRRTDVFMQRLGYRPRLPATDKETLQLPFVLPQIMSRS